METSPKEIENGGSQSLDIKMFSLISLPASWQPRWAEIFLITLFRRKTLKVSSWLDIVVEEGNEQSVAYGSAVDQMNYIIMINQIFIHVILWCPFITSIILNICITYHLILRKDWRTILLHKHPIAQTFLGIPSQWLSDQEILRMAMRFLVRGCSWLKNAGS